MASIWAMRADRWIEELLNRPRPCRDMRFNSGDGVAGNYLPPQWKLNFEEWWARHQDQLDCSKATAFEVWKGACREE